MVSVGTALAPREGIEMKHYLLSVVQPAGGEPPAPEVLDGIMAEVGRVQQQMKDALQQVSS